MPQLVKEVSCIFVLDSSGQKLQPLSKKFYFLLSKCLTVQQSYSEVYSHLVELEESDCKYEEYFLTFL